MTEITVHKAKSSLSKLLAQVEAGEEIVVCRGPTRIAKLIPYRESAGPRPKVGEITSARIRVKRGCFDPLTEKEAADWGMAKTSHVRPSIHS